MAPEIVPQAKYNPFQQTVSITNSKTSDIVQVFIWNVDE